jgi:hypothetical protein
MSLPMTKTLEELQLEVLLRCGYSTEGNQSASVAPLVNSLIIGSERELFPECQWINAESRVSVSLSTDNSSIDWPDDAEPGDVKQMWVQHASTLVLYEMLPGVHLNERSSSTVGESGKPLLYEVIDGGITIFPPPSDDYSTIYMSIRLAPSMAQAEDRCVVDPEVLIQRATMKFKEYLGQSIGQMEMANHERYLARLRASNASKGGFVIGGHKSWRTQVQKNNRVNRSDNLSANSAYSNEWNPW